MSPRVAVLPLVVLALAVLPATAAADPCGADFGDGLDTFAVFDWDLSDEGSVSDGEDDAYDTAYRLRTTVTGNPEVLYTPADPNGCTNEDGGRERVYPEVVTNGLGVSRKVFVPARDREQTARWLTILRNTTGAPLSVSFRYDGSWGVDGGLVLATGDGDRTAEVLDGWVAQAEETEVLSFWDSRAPGTPDRYDALPDGPRSSPNSDDDMNVIFSGITLAPGATAVYAAVDVPGLPGRDDLTALGRANGGGPAVVYEGLSPSELANLRNFPAAPDTDGDGLPDAVDRCPGLESPDNADPDGDGLANPCDPDDDGDGASDALEALLGTGAATADSDGDGVRDGADACPTVRGLGANGCPRFDVQSIAFLGQQRAQRTSATLSPSRDTRAPFRFTVRGAITPPAGLSAQQACSPGGLVTVAARRGSRTLRRASARLRADCSYSVALTIRTRRQLRGARSLTLRTTFAGNRFLEPATLRSLTARTR